MLETPHLPMARPAAPGEGALRVPDWSEISARFAAARQLRAALHGEASYGGGGFARFAAVDAADGVNAKAHPVNLTGLVHGKVDAGTLSASDKGFTEADREMQ